MIGSNDDELVKRFAEFLQNVMAGEEGEVVSLRLSGTDGLDE